MNSRKFAAVFLCIFLLGVCPLLMVQSAGGVSAGLSTGFMMSLQMGTGVILFTVCGLLSVLCGLAASLFLPLLTLLLFLIGAGLELGAAQFAYTKLLLFAWMLVFATTLYVLHSRRFLVFVLALGVPAFHMGGEYVVNMPDSIDAVSYLLGSGITALLMSGIGICIGVTVTEFMEAGVEKLKTAPVASSFFTWLL